MLRPSRLIFEPPAAFFTFRNASRVVVKKVTDNNVTDKRPFVVVLGWAGGKAEHVAKYATFYNKCGYDTVTYTAERHQSALPTLQLAKPLVHFLYNSSNDSEFKTRSFIVHALSMNSIRSLISIRRDLVHSFGQEEAARLWLNRVKGIVFDSAPSRTEAEADTIAQMLSTPSVKGIPDSWRRAVAYTKFASRLLITDSVPWLRKHLRLVDVFTREVPLPSRQLFFYSTSDVMVPHSGIEKFIEEQRAKGYSVTAHRFTDSAHVAHYRTHPKEYELAVKTFLSQLDNT